MRLYFTLRSIPELANLEPRELARIWRRYFLRAFGRWQTWVAVFLIAFPGVIVMELLPFWIALPCRAFTLFIFVQVVIHQFRACLRLQMARINAQGR